MNHIRAMLKLQLLLSTLFLTQIDFLSPFLALLQRANKNLQIARIILTISSCLRFLKSCMC